MKAYVRLDEGCRRKFLLNEFSSEINYSGHKHLCCDLCAVHCKCDEPCPFKPPLAETLAINQESDVTVDPPRVRQLTHEQRCCLRVKLMDLRQSLLANTHDHTCTVAEKGTAFDFKSQTRFAYSELHSRISNAIGTCLTRLPGLVSPRSM